MKKLIAVLLVLVSVSVFAEEACKFKSEAEESAVVILIEKLKARDLTIKELSEKNLELMVDKIHLQDIQEALNDKVITLKEANAQLRASLKKTNSAMVTYKNQAAKATKVVYKQASEQASKAKKESVKAVRDAIKALDVYLSEIQ